MKDSIMTLFLKVPLNHKQIKDKVIISITEIILNTSSTLKVREESGKASITDILNNPLKRTERWAQPLPFRRAGRH